MSSPILYVSIHLFIVIVRTRQSKNDKTQSRNYVKKQTHTASKTGLGINRPLKAVTDNPFHNILRQNDKAICSHLVQITHCDTQRLQHHNSSVLKTSLSDDAQFRKLFLVCVQKSFSVRIIQDAVGTST